MGPQNAVVVAVSNPVASNNRLRVSEILTPKFSAYRVPSNIALRGLESRNAIINPIIDAVVK